VYQKTGQFKVMMYPQYIYYVGDITHGLEGMRPLLPTIEDHNCSKVQRRSTIKNKGGESNSNSARSSNDQKEKRIRTKNKRK